MSLSVSHGQATNKGIKNVNQDRLGFLSPDSRPEKDKGVIAAVADGISSSDVSDIASEITINTLISDYYLTSELWSTKQALEKIVRTINDRLLAETNSSAYRGNPNRGYVCTLSATVLRQQVAHLIHIGDSRIYRLRRGNLEQLTRDHQALAPGNKSYLSNAMGFKTPLQFDYAAIQLARDDVFFLMTDGIFDFVPHDTFQQIMNQFQHDLDLAAQTFIETALNNGSHDNLSINILRVDHLEQIADGPSSQTRSLPIPPVWQVGQHVDDYIIQRHIYQSARSHVYLAKLKNSEAQLLIKAPSIEQQDNQEFLEQLITEEWVARKTHSQHLISAPKAVSNRTYLYSVLNYFEGQTLAQWLVDNPNPPLETVRDIIEQVSKGVLALHRNEILHQDIRPENILINSIGLVKLIDLGSAYVKGAVNNEQEPEGIPGTALYAAPEYFIGDIIDERADQFSLAVLCYYMLSQRYPYQTNVAKARSVAAQKKLHYESVIDPQRTIPLWLNDTLKKALHPNPYNRYETLSEFIYDLRHPNPAYIRKNRPPLIERDPVTFWKLACLGLAIALLISFTQ